jgi:hypothetical protein
MLSALDLQCPQLDPKDPSNLYQIGATGDVPNKHHFIMGIPGDGPGYFPLASNEAPLTGIWPSKCVAGYIRNIADTTVTDQALTLPGNKTALVDAAVVNNGLTVGYNALFVVDIVPPTSNDPVNKPLNITRVKSGAGNGLFYDVSRGITMVLRETNEVLLGCCTLL